MLSRYYSWRKNQSSDALSYFLFRISTFPFSFYPPIFFLSSRRLCLFDYFSSIPLLIPLPVRKRLPPTFYFPLFLISFPPPPLLSFFACDRIFLVIEALRFSLCRYSIPLLAALLRNLDLLLCCSLYSVILLFTLYFNRVCATFLLFYPFICLLLRCSLMILLKSVFADPSNSFLSLYLHVYPLLILSFSYPTSYSLFSFISISAYPLSPILSPFYCSFASLSYILMFYSICSSCIRFLICSNVTFQMFKIQLYKFRRFWISDWYFSINILLNKCGSCWNKFNNYYLQYRKILFHRFLDENNIYHVHHNYWYMTS